MNVKVLILLSIFESVLSEIDYSYIDESVDPCDDFYKFSCAKFPEINPRPTHYKNWDLFTITENDLVKIGKEILSSPKNKNDNTAIKKAKIAFRSCVNLPEIDNFSIKPEKEIIKEVGGMPLLSDSSKKELSFAEIGNIAGSFGVSHLFKIIIRNFNVDNYAILLFPDSEETPQMIRPETLKTYDELLEDSFKNFIKSKRGFSKTADPLEVFLWKTCQYLLKLDGSYSQNDKEIEKELNKIKEFATNLYAGGIVDDDMIPLKEAIELWELQDWTNEQFKNGNNINWYEYLNGQFKYSNVKLDNNSTVYFLSSDYVYGALNLIQKTDPKVVKNFILLKTFLYMAPESHSELRLAFEEYYNALGLTYYDRSDYCARKILDIVDLASLSFAVSNQFTNYYFDINKIPEAVKIIKSVYDIFSSEIATTDWLDDETRTAVNKKLHNVAIHLGFPDFVNNETSLNKFYENFRICSGDNYGNAQRLRAFKQGYKLNQYEDHNLWTVSPFKVNAFAVLASLKIMAPIAILHSNYLHGRDPIFDYSRFGIIIAHEMIHHFDPDGISYNETGYRSSLLSDSVKAVYSEKKQCFVDQYSKYYIPEIDRYVDGEQTLNENMADNAGVKHAFAAFKKTLKNGSFHVDLGKYSPEQQFFINYATGWCDSDSVSYLEDLVENNSHPPNYVRVLGPLSNMKEFAEAFKCPIGSKMNPKNKCEIW